MNRKAWLVALASVLLPASAFAQFGGMGGMGGVGGITIRRNVQVEMEGGRRLTGTMDVPTLMVRSDLGQHTIVPSHIKMIRFLKPANLPTPDAGDGDDQGIPQGPVPAPPMGARMGVPNNRIVRSHPLHAKVILHSGEEIVGDIQNAPFHLEVDYGHMTPASDKLRSMTFTEPEQKPGSPEPAPAAADRTPASSRLLRFSDAVVIQSPARDRVVLYDIGTRKLQEFSGPENGPIEVGPMYGQGLMALFLHGPRITRVAVAESNSGWHVQDLRQPFHGRLVPTVGQGIVVYTAGRVVYAFSAQTGRWAVIELLATVHATPMIGPDTVTIEGGGHLYTFSAKTGLWDHVDLGALLDGSQPSKK